MPDIDHFRIANEIALPELYALCKVSLCDASRLFRIDAPGGQRLSQDLVQLLQGAALEVNCFAIYTRQANEPWCMRYLGQTSVQRVRATLSACLLPGSARVHPVYARFSEALQSGCHAGLRLIRVEPDTLRHFVHEKLIAEMRQQGELDWNRPR